MREFVLTVDEAAKAMKISRPTFEKFIKREDNPLPHIRSEGRILIPVNSLERWLEEETARCAKKNQ